MMTDAAKLNASGKNSTAKETKLTARVSNSTA